MDSLLEQIEDSLNKLKSDGVTPISIEVSPRCKEKLEEEIVDNAKTRKHDFDHFYAIFRWHYDQVLFGLPFIINENYFIKGEIAWRLFYDCDNTIVAQTFHYKPKPKTKAENPDDHLFAKDGKIKFWMDEIAHNIIFPPPQTFNINFPCIIPGEYIYGSNTMSENIQVKDPDGKEYTVNPADLKPFNEKLERDIKAVEKTIAKLEKMVESGGECWPFFRNGKCDLCVARERGESCYTSCPARSLFRKRSISRETPCQTYIPAGRVFSAFSINYIFKLLSFYPGGVPVKEFEIIKIWAARAIDDFNALLSDLKAQR